MIDIIGFDADDTLWHNESLYSVTQEKFSQILAPYHDAEWVERRLYETESRNLHYFGYGIKGFTLSMIETAIELTEGRIGGSEIQQIIDFGKEMVKAPIKLMAHVDATLSDLSNSHELMIITKGDLFDQESKIARSGLADYFKHIEIVSEKTEATYREILVKYEILPERFLFVGNSLRSDILPVVAIGGRAVHVPYHITWVHERVPESDREPEGYFNLENIDQLPALVRSI